MERRRATFSQNWRPADRRRRMRVNLTRKSVVEGIPAAYLTSAAKMPRLVRQQWCEVGAVKVRVGHALSGAKATITASQQGGVGSNRSQTAVRRITCLPCPADRPACAGHGRQVERRAAGTVRRAKHGAGQPRAESLRQSGSAGGGVQPNALSLPLSKFGCAERRSRPRHGGGSHLLYRNFRNILAKRAALSYNNQVWMHTKHNRSCCPRRMSRSG